MPGFPIDDPSPARATAPRSDSRHSLEGVPVDSPREPSRYRWLVVGLVALVPIVIALLFLLRRPSTANSEADAAYLAAEDAARARAWTRPPGQSVADITNDGMRRFPDDERFVRLRRESAERIVAEALQRKYEGDIASALALLKTALEWNADLPPAKLLLRELEPGSNGPQILPLASAPIEEPSSRAARPTTRAGKATSSATPTATTKLAPSAGPYLPNDPPPISDDGPPPSSTGRPWL